MRVSLPTLEVAPPRAPTRQRSGRLLRDQHGRAITDLRLSLTDRCNFRCVYCLEPDVRFLPKQELLHRDEYLRIVRACRDLGVRTLRLTGGEPTLYPELDDLIDDLRTLELDEIAMTTNGWRLDEVRARRWRESGLTRLTFSLDTLREDRMRTITRSRTRVADVLRSIETARAVGFPRPKVNVVVMKGLNEDELPDFATLAAERDLDIRFIEFMPLDAAREWSRDGVVTAPQMRAAIAAHTPIRPRVETNRHSTSRNWIFRDGRPGNLGFIAPVSSPFCGACNRLRITAEGKIRPCLFSHDEWDLRPVLRRGLDQKAVMDFLIDAAWNKEAGHGIDDPEFTQPARTMSAIGG